MRVLITPGEACEAWERADARLRVGLSPVLTHGEVGDPDRLRQLLADVDAAVLGIERVAASELEDARSLRIISRFGVGYDAIDTKELVSRGIKLAIIPGATSHAVARHTLAFALAATIQMPANDRRLKRGEWRRISNYPPTGTRLGLVGCGAVGSRVAKLAAPLGFEVRAVRRSRAPVDGLPGVAWSESVDELIESSDIVSLHVPLTVGTRGMISGPRVRMLDGKVLINTSRGALVSEREVLESLDEPNGLRCYMTDVFEYEPVEGVSKRLAQHPGVLATPHVAAFDPSTAVVMLERALANVVCFSNGEHDAVDAYVV